MNPEESGIEMQTLNKKVPVTNDDLQNSDQAGENSKANTKNKEEGKMQKLINRQVFPVVFLFTAVVAKKWHSKAENTQLQNSRNRLE